MSRAVRAADNAEWWPRARRIPSPNFDERPQGALIELIVIHAISLPPDEFGSQGIIQLFTNQLDPQEHPYFREIQDLRVSAHFLVRRDGELIQFVPCARRAWHAGVSIWQGRENCNDFSIGIELEGCDRLPFEDAQYRALNRLLTQLRRRYPIDAVVGHSDIAPGRKTDPGPCFDWRRVRRVGS
ncbi:MAG: 1,6-anhydro-N-acetylmuramyl-L-alanine amidase AmpD [Sulfuritalea sp.]|nr:1,6-anhydro-N-acetylmuramyl-L-alanine amidase AmpD [Sulfuritalea sp.]MDP1983940.1 1,6-anhydro-N-acetylmuramyl-L-alanine amidase AmpD [Sulfuritalea sp.]